MWRRGLGLFGSNDGWLIYMVIKINYKKILRNPND